MEICREANDYSRREGNLVASSKRSVQKATCHGFFVKWNHQNGVQGEEPPTNALRIITNRMWLPAGCRQSTKSSIAVNSGYAERQPCRTPSREGESSPQAGALNKISDGCCT